MPRNRHYCFMLGGQVGNGDLKHDLNGSPAQHGWHCGRYEMNMERALIATGDLQGLRKDAKEVLRL